MWYAIVLAGGAAIAVNAKKKKERLKYKEVMKKSFGMFYNDGFNSQ